MGRKEELEARVAEIADRLARDFSDLGADVRWQVARALIHRGIHTAADSPSVEFCAIATYLAEMTSHAHRISHGEAPGPAHGNLKH